MKILDRRYGGSPGAACRLSSIVCFSIGALALGGLLAVEDAHAKRGRFPVMTQVTHNTTGDVESIKITSEKGKELAFVSDGDVLGGPAPVGREVYYLDVLTGTITRVTNAAPGVDNHSATRVSDVRTDGGRPQAIAFVSNGDLDEDPTNGISNPDGNEEIFLYSTNDGSTHQLTDTVLSGAGVPVVNSQPWITDTGKCITWVSTGDMDNNDGSFNQAYPGTGFSNPDGSEELYVYKVEDENFWPHDGFFNQVTDSPPGTFIREPVTGGYTHHRQCQTTPFVSNFDHTGQGIPGTRMALWKRTRFQTEAMRTDTYDDGLVPSGDFANLHMSGASQFARGPFVTFDTNVDIWNNGYGHRQIFKYRIFHDRMTQVTGLETGDALDPEIGDGGGWIIMHSDAEVLSARHGTRAGIDGPYNPDGNYEIFLLRTRKLVTQITQTEGCQNTMGTVTGSGEDMAWRSTCDLIPGFNPSGVPQIFLYRKLEKGNPELEVDVCIAADGCCNVANGCLTELVRRQIKPRKRHRQPE